MLAVVDWIAGAIEAAFRWLFWAIGWLICYALAAIIMVLVIVYILCVGLWLLAPIWMPLVPGGVNATPYLLLAVFVPGAVWVTVLLVKWGISVLRDALRRWGVRR